MVNVLKKTIKNYKKSFVKTLNQIVFNCRGESEWVLKIEYKIGTVNPFLNFRYKINDKRFNMITTNTPNLFRVTLSRRFSFHQAKSQKSPSQYILRRFCASSKCINFRGSRDTSGPTKKCFLMSSENLLSLVTAH